MNLLVSRGGDILSFLEVAEWRRIQFEDKHLGSKKTSSGTIATGLLFVFLVVYYSPMSLVDI